ncbi:TPA: hypothetical protein J1Y54_000058 [Escherichia coli]|nr:hypothetical protein [Escherichia coli]
MKRWHPFRLFRFIPAGAGNSEKPSLALLNVPVYPRWRGELLKINGRDIAFRGLSPLARGTPAR